MKTRLLSLLLVSASVLAAHSVAAEADPRGATAWGLARASSDVQAYLAAAGSLPSSPEGVDALVSHPADLVDGGGRPVVYLRVAGGFWLVSWGADGVPGGTGDAADLVQISR